MLEETRKKGWCGMEDTRLQELKEIREKLKEADKNLRPVPFKAGMAIARKFMLRKKSS